MAKQSKLSQPDDAKALLKPYMIHVIRNGVSYREIAISVDLDTALNVASSRKVFTEVKS